MRIELGRPDINAGDRPRVQIVDAAGTLSLSAFLGDVVDPFLPRNQGRWIVRAKTRDGARDVATVSSAGAVELLVPDDALERILDEPAWLACRIDAPHRS